MARSPIGPSRGPNCKGTAKLTSEETTESEEKPGENNPINFEFLIARDGKAKPNKHCICDIKKDGSKELVNSFFASMNNFKAKENKRAPKKPMHAIENILVG